MFGIIVPIPVVFQYFHGGGGGNLISELPWPLMGLLSIVLVGFALVCLWMCQLAFEDKGFYIFKSAVLLTMVPFAIASVYFAVAIWFV